MSLQCPSLIAGQYSDLCRAVDHYCERTSPDLDAELINAFTNAAFLIAAALAWRLQSQHGPASTTILVRILIVAMAAVGLGSFLFHTVGTRWSEWGDVIPILVFMLLYLWFALTYLFVWPVTWRLIALALFCVATFTLEARIPGDVLWGGALYIPTILTFLVIVAALKMSGHAAAGAMIGATAVFLAALVARSSDMPVCETFPLGTHFLWHLLNATLLYLLVRLAILKVPAEAIARSRLAAS